MAAINRILTASSMVGIGSDRCDAMALNGCDWELPAPAASQQGADQTDLLIRCDHTSPDRWPAMLEAAFPDATERRSFARLLQDRLLRARLELEFNQSLTFPDYLLLRKAGYVRAEEYISRSRIAHGQEFCIATATDKHRARAIALPGLADPHSFFAPFIEAYLTRHTGAGIVLTRDTLEVALDIGDAELLALTVDPELGQPVAGDVEVTPLPGDILDHRRRMLDWWSVPDRGVVIHDLDRELRTV